MAMSLDNLISYLLDEIALSGEEGTRHLHVHFDASTIVNSFDTFSSHRVVPWTRG